MNTTYPIELPRVLVDEFDRKGFVVTSGLFEDDEIARYGRLVDEEVARRTAHDRRRVIDKSLYEQSFVQCMRLWETNPDIVPLSCHAGLAGIAAQLLQVDSVRLWQDQALYKEPGGRETTPHQDQTFWPIGDAPLVSAWIPFADVTLEHGAMAYVPGSHRAGRLRVVDITHSTDPYDILQDPALNGAEPEWVEVSAGSVVWHHGLTVHLAAANQSTTTRRVFTTVYIGAGATRVRDWPTFPLDRDNVAVGATIEGPGMPVLWPPAREYPAPPDIQGTPTGPQISG